MSIINLNFLKYKPGQCLAKCDLYAKMCDTDDVISELEDMPKKAILEKIAEEFSDWHQVDEYEYRKVASEYNQSDFKDGAEDADACCECGDRCTDAGFFIGMIDNMMCFECNDMEQADIDRIVSVMAGFDIAPFDMQMDDMVDLEF